MPLPLLHLWVGHKQCAMLFRKYVSRTAAGSGRAVLEGVGLPNETIQMCYSKTSQNEEEAIQSGLMKWRDGGGDSPTWAVLVEAMHYAQIGVQHIEAMKEELLKGAVWWLFSEFLFQKSSATLVSTCMVHSIFLLYMRFVIIGCVGIC